MSLIYWHDFQENVLLRHTGMNLDEIRNLSDIDFHVHFQMCLAYENKEREFQLKLVGAEPKTTKVTGNNLPKGLQKGQKYTMRKRFNPETGVFE